MKKFFSNLNLVRTGLAIACVAIILLLIPRADHQSYTYELNQPWKYQLLTADFDMPILRDSTSAREMRDSINRNFIPFVRRNATTGKANIEKFTKALHHEETPAAEARAIAALLQQVYNRGILEADIYDRVSKFKHPTVRVTNADGQVNSVTGIDASDMNSPRSAFEYIDSVYTTMHQGSQISQEAIKALNVCLVPNIVVDSAADTKYRNQEYLNVDGALGVIKKGQRIVDRGELVTPQVYTNLNTYLEMLESRQKDQTSHTYFYLGQGLYIIICILLLYCFLYFYRRTFFDNMRQMLFLMTFIICYVIFAIVMFEYVPNGLYLVPFAAVPVTIRIFFDSRTAIFSLLTTVLICALVATFQFQFIIMELSVGLAATYSITQLSKRSQLLRTAIISFAVYTVIYITLSLVTEGTLDSFNWHNIGYFAINSVVLSFAYILILVVEKIFGFISIVTLVELSDINNPLLRRLAEEAPGTFQHSMQVSTLASEAARAIDANTQLVRTGALYHDIGKMESPVFFTENQHGVNPHAGLDPETSARKIISHVTAGLQIAGKSKLPSVIKDFISEHHGTGVAKYFYTTALNQSPDGQVDKSKFQYPGPNPRSKETAILMMADAVEAASRSLKDYSTEAIDTLVDKIIDSQISDGLMKDSPISFRDVETVKATFKKRLATIYHARIAYPEVKKS